MEMEVPHILIKSQVFPFQNNLTENTLTARSAQKYGTFSNGYQPKGILGYGELSIAEKNSDGTALCYEMNGRNCTIWKAKDKKGSIIFGDNGSGKTVFLRSVSICQILAQAGVPS